MHSYSYKFRLYPNQEQEILLAKRFGCDRYIYNYFLNKTIEDYKNNKKTNNKYDNINLLPLLKIEFPWLQEADAQSLQFAVESLDLAYKNFFRKVKQKTKGKKGFPKFKKKYDKQSFRVKQSIKIVKNKLFIPKIKEGIEVIIDRPVEGQIRFATISKNKANQYYVSITVQREITPLPTSDKAIGIDLNVIAFVDSNNHEEPNPRPGDEYKTRIKFLNKEVSRKVKGSNGRRKAKIKLAKVHLKIHNKRENHLHKLSKTIINENQVICVEDLDVKAMLAKTKPENRVESCKQEKKRHFDIADCGFYSFIQKLCYKATLYGRELIKVSRWFPSSQLCHHCNYQNKELTPWTKVWCCWNCFNHNPRDYNAACNILYEGLRLRTCGTQGIAACYDIIPGVKLGLLFRAEANTSSIGSS